jgi:hypothetical protein
VEASSPAARARGGRARLRCGFVYVQVVRLRFLQLDSVNVCVVSLSRLVSSSAFPGGAQFSFVGGLRESTSPAACAQMRVAVRRFTPGLSVGAGGVQLVALGGELEQKVSS